MGMSCRIHPQYTETMQGHDANLYLFMTTSSAASDDKVGITTTFQFQCMDDQKMGKII